MNCVMLEAAVLDDVPDGTKLCIVRAPFKIFGRSSGIEAPCFAPIVPFLQLAFVAYSL